MIRSTEMDVGNMDFLGLPSIGSSTTKHARNKTESAHGMINIGNLESPNPDINR